MIKSGKLQKALNEAFFLEASANHYNYLIMHNVKREYNQDNRELTRRLINEERRANKATYG
jgi:hypothetical protein